MIFKTEGSDPLKFIPLLVLAPWVQADDCVSDLLNAQRDKHWIYQVNYQGMGTEARRRLESSESGRWNLSQSMSLLIVSLSEQSSMQLADGKLSTLSYVKEQKGLGARKTEIRVDPVSQQVESVYKGSAASYAVAGPVFDPLSHSLQIQIDRHCFGLSTALNYSLLGRTGLKEYRYQWLGEESTVTPWGELLAERWQRVEGDTRDTLWLAPSKEFALVRVEHEEKGELSSLVLSRIEAQ